MNRLLRPVAALAAGVVITSGLATAPAHAAPDRDAGRWLESQLTDGAISAPFGEGLTVDIGLAFSELGMRSARAQVRDAMASRVDTYTAPSEGEVYAGPSAKLLVFAQEAGADPTSYGGVDLVTRVNRTVARSGRVADRSEFGDFANTIGQAFAARGLARAGSRKADRVISFLLRQQCDPGFFRLDFSGPSRDQSCDDARRANRRPDTDVTALAVLNLRELPRAERTRAVRRALTGANRWLRGTQKRNGSFGGGVATEASNANSTGLAAWALGSTGSCRPARQAARWVRALQVDGDEAGTPLAGDTGAIAYDRTALEAARSQGITDTSRDQWRRTTAQAAPGLRFLRGC